MGVNDSGQWAPLHQAAQLKIVPPKKVKYTPLDVIMVMPTPDLYHPDAEFKASEYGYNMLACDMQTMTCDYNTAPPSDSWAMRECIRYAAMLFPQ